MDCNRTPMISILVSCYNVQKFIPGFFNEIRNQTFKDYEIIIVDDGSTDNTLEILKQFANESQNVKVVTHKFNKGLGAGRNTGLNEARGKYVYFCDVDDKVKPDLLDYCSRIMEENESLNYIVFGFDVSYPDMDLPDETILFNEMLLRSNKEVRDIYVENLLLSRHGNGFVWNKFYRKSFLDRNNIRFGKEKIQQDEVFNIKVLLSTDSLYISPVSLYKYNIFSSGNNGSRYIEDRFEIFVNVRENFELLFDKWGIHTELTDAYLNKRFFGNVLKCLLYDLTHPKCNLTRREKQMRFKEITTHRFSKEFRTYYKAHKSKLGIKDKLYLNSMNSYALFYVVNSIINALYKLKTL